MLQIVPFSRFILIFFRLCLFNALYSSFGSLYWIRAVSQNQQSGVTQRWSQAVDNLFRWVKPGCLGNFSNDGLRFGSFQAPNADGRAGNQPRASPS